MNLEIQKEKPRYIEKEWGYELWLANDIILNVCTKILFIKKDKKFSMHFHDIKKEYFYIQNGKCILSVLDLKKRSPTTDQVVLKEGDSFFIDRLVPHQLKALVDTTIIETSTFHRDDDSFRVWR
jgi:mannose-6-phosphate isomerase-like protein (cupin superfamily)